MDTNEFAKKMSKSDKVKLVHGDGSWHTNAVGGLPSIMMTDGPHGLRKQAEKNKGVNDSAKATCFPTACAVASSWNTENARLVADGIAAEAVAENVSVVLGPGINIKRSPLCGRNFEYYSEDPFLAGEMGVSYVSGMQARKVGCTLKHFAVNSQETNRMTINAIVDERALREIYLAAFERVVKKAQPYAVMASYNKINGTYATQNKHLLTEILREEWGYDGLVMSDWGACYDMGKAIGAGMDLEMPSGGIYHEKKTSAALEKGKLTEKDLNRACENVAKLVDKCSCLKEKVAVDYAAHHEICRKIENDSAVLLKNDGVLPLDKNQKYLVVGEMAAKPRYQGAGSSHINTSCKNFLDVLKDSGVEYDYVRGYNVAGDCFDSKLEAEAVEAARKAGTVLFFGGLTDSFEGEGYDRKKMDIPFCQQRLLQKLYLVNENITFVMFGGSPVTMNWLGKVRALLHMYLGGEAVCESAYDLLFGRVSPSGRLAETYPLRLEETPCYNYYLTNKHVDEHRESIFVGYRYYNSFDIPVLFPFGFGLSYTKFAYSDLKVEKADGGFEAEVTVTNVGEYDGSEVVQLYVDNCDCGYMRAKRELRGFTKVNLRAGESVAVRIRIENDAFRLYTSEGYKTVAGNYKVCICSDVNTLLASCDIAVEGEDVIGNDRERFPSYFERQSGSWFINADQFYQLAETKKKSYKSPDRGDYTLLNTLSDMIPKVSLVRKLVNKIEKTAINNSPTKMLEDPVAQMIYQGALTTPLISLMSVGGVPAKYVLFLLHHANNESGKALLALFGRCKVE